jgi:hypothetical protein
MRCRSSRIILLARIRAVMLASQGSAGYNFEARPIGVTLIIRFTNNNPRSPQSTMISMATISSKSLVGSRDCCDENCFGNRGSMKGGEPAARAVRHSVSCLGKKERPLRT